MHQRLQKELIMTAKRLIPLIVSHLMVGIIGFAIGIYTLPILTAPEAPSNKMVEQLSQQSVYRAAFTKSLKDSDFLHWGEGTVTIGTSHITLQGELSPGPDFKLYLSPTFVETEADFNKLKSSMRVIGDVNTFSNFAVSVPNGVDVHQFNTVIVWCESFGEFITAAKYQ